jgi:hypothetical protein
VDVGSGSRRPYPSFYAILRYFETFRQAWSDVQSHTRDRH